MSLLTPAAASSLISAPAAVRGAEAAERRPRAARASYRYTYGAMHASGSRSRRCHADALPDSRPAARAAGSHLVQVGVAVLLQARKRLWQKAAEKQRAERRNRRGRGGEPARVGAMESGSAADSCTWREVRGLGRSGGGGRQLALAKAAKKAAWSLAKRSTCGLKRASVTRATSVCSIMSDGSAAHLIRVRVRLRGEEDWGLGLASRARARRRTPSAACPWWARPRASTRTREAAGSTCRGRRGW